MLSVACSPAKEKMKLSKSVTQRSAYINKNGVDISLEISS